MNKIIVNLILVGLHLIRPPQNNLWVPLAAFLIRPPYYHFVRNFYDIVYRTSCDFDSLMKVLPVNVMSHPNSRSTDTLGAFTETTDSFAVKLYGSLIEYR